MPETARRFSASIFQALGNPTRLAIVEALHRGERSVGQLCAELGLEQANASQHLAVLRARSIVSTQKLGNQVLYRLADPVFAELVGLLRGFFARHIADSLKLLDAEAGASDRGTARGPDVR